MDRDSHSVGSTKRTPPEFSVNFHSAEVQQLDPVGLEQRPVVVNLSVVCRREPLNRLQLIGHALHDQIQPIDLLESVKRNNDRHLGVDIIKSLGAKPRRQIVFINRFLTKAAQFVLRSISATHHHLIDFIKLNITEQTNRSIVKDWHRAPKIKKLRQRRKSNERQKNKDKGMFSFNPFLCPHSLVFSLLCRRGRAKTAKQVSNGKPSERQKNKDKGMFSFISFLCPHSLVLSLLCRRGRAKTAKQVRNDKPDQGQRNGDKGMFSFISFLCPHSLVLSILCHRSRAKTSVKQVRNGKSNERQKNKDKGMFSFNPFPCPHSLVLSLLLPLCAQAADPRAVMPQKHAAFFENYCLDCHDAATEKGKVNLEDLSFDLATIQSAELWQKVLNTINSGEMPPEKKPQPTDAEKSAFLEDLSAQLVTARKVLSDTGGEITMRRLNRREYENTLADLLGVEVNAKDLPADSNSEGFDTFGSALFFSSDQFEQYLALARKALDAAIVTGPKPETKTVRIEAEEEANRRIRMIFRGYQKQGFTAWKRWQASNGKPTSDFGFVDDKEIEFRKLVWDRESPDYADYLSREETLTGAFLTVSTPNSQVGLAIPDAAPAGRYRVRAKIAFNRAAKPDPSQTFVEIGFRGDDIEGAIDLIDCIKVNAPMTHPEVIESEIKLPPLSRPLTVEVGSQTKKKVTLGERVIAFRQRLPNSRDAGRFLRSESVRETGFNHEPALWIDWVEWEGPLVEAWPPASHQAIFFKGSDAEKTDTYAREIVERFATRAFRTLSPAPEFLDQLMGFYQAETTAGKPFEEALKKPLSIVLSSPSFLYLAEPVSERESPSLTPRELAVRLSYFLWSAPPDEALLAAAKKGVLDTPAGLTRQVDQLLTDSRAAEFVSGFTHQWLHMERLDFFNYNYRLYPEFDDSVKMAARQEVYQTILNLLGSNRPLAELLKSDTVVINELLADYYGIEGVRGPKFREVKVPADLPRGGLLGMAAILAMGSDGERSSPVERGTWVMRKLLHAPPPPAPPNVPQLSRHAGKLLPARDLLQAHMEEAQCAQCHRRIDPIGYGLEHFDAVGLWRETEYTEIAANNRVKQSKEHPIDDTGTLPDGTEFDGFFELRDAIATRHEAFARGFVEHLIAYALGRPYGFTDQDLADAILAQASKQKATPRAYIHALVQSEAFRRK